MCNSYTATAQKVKQMATAASNSYSTFGFQ